MNKTLIALGFVAGVVSCTSQEQEQKAKLKYPQTAKVDTVDTYFGIEVPDPYRWLEDDRSKETA